jgi:hypothetical protein
VSENSLAAMAAWQGGWIDPDWVLEDSTVEFDLEI